MPNQNTEIPIILASSSAARQTMLRQAGLTFAVIPADVDEATIKANSTGSLLELAMNLAKAKAAKISASRPADLVIGADQLLICNGIRFDKPADLFEAAAHLRALRGQTHSLVTATCVYRGGKAVWSHIAEPKLTMRDVSEKFISAYLSAEGDDLCNSVGAYHLESLGINLFSKIEGDFFTILGLPLLALLGFLRQAGALES